MDDDLAFAGALELRRRIAAKEVSPREITGRYLDRIERLDQRLRSYLTVTPEGALRAARAAEDAVMRGGPLGPLHGVPVSIKDTEDTRGVRTTKGSLIYRDHVPSADALPVERILGAGAVMLGKSNCPEFGLIGDTTNRLLPAAGGGGPVATPGIPIAARAGRPAAARRRWLRGCARCRRGATAAARYAARQASAVYTGSRRLWDGWRATPAPACSHR